MEKPLDDLSSALKKTQLIGKFEAQSRTMQRVNSKKHKNSISIQSLYSSMTFKVGYESYKGNIDNTVKSVLHKLGFRDSKSDKKMPNLIFSHRMKLKDVY